MINRRDFLKKTAKIGIGAGLVPFTRVLDARAGKRLKTIILGIDGMDSHLVQVYMNKGLLPNFSKLAQIGSFHSTGTSFPAQSPVAWSSLSVGAGPGLHGIYDFIHRDPATMIPYLSTSKVTSAKKKVHIGQWEIPISGGSVENLRKGKPFWEYLADHDIPTTVFKMPGNFPCQSKKVDMVSGMGTPDLRGGYGSFTLFTTRSVESFGEVTGGMVVPINFHRGMAEAVLPGARNTLLQGQPDTIIPIKIWRDHKNSVVRLLIQEKEFLLKKGEWSDWIQLSFTMMPMISEVQGICKIFIKHVHPEFMMYVSPINIDPSDPVLPVVSSASYGKKLVEHVGPFYTQGLPEDTKALSHGILSDREYLDLAFQIIDERQRLLDYELGRFSRLENGFLFFYFSSLDQDTHMFWRTLDAKHPSYSEQLHQDHGHILAKIYMEMDKSLGDVLDRFDISDPDFRLIVMSDHGFAPFRRQVNVNTWLHQNGYIELRRRNDMAPGEFFADVIWNQTAAYALGINAVYLNLEGRERFGAVPPSQGKQVLKKIQKDLFLLRDEKTGEKVVSNIRVVPDVEKQANPHAPDLIIGWNRGYRTSWDSILGGFSEKVIRDNDDKWSGDHCIDPSLVPAVLFTNRQVTKSSPDLCDITATILAEFGISVPPQMTGRSLYPV